MNSLTPPLPHLSGPTPLPAVVKRARVGFTLCALGAALLLSPFVLAFMVRVRHVNNFTLPGGKIDVGTVVVVLFLVGVVPTAAGLVFGFLSRKVPLGKTALIAGGICFSLWLCFLAAALLNL